MDGKKNEGFLFLKLKNGEQISEAIQLVLRRCGHDPANEELRKQLDRILYGYRQDSITKTDRTKEASHEK